MSQSQYLAVEGNRIHYRTAGEGPLSLVMIHGAGGSWQALAPQLELGNSGLRVIIPDLPGHGHSEGLAQDSVPIYAEFLHEFMQNLGLSQLVLAGHSLGGAIAQEFALSWPESLNALILLSTGARLRVGPTFLTSLAQEADGLPASALELNPNSDPETMVMSPMGRYLDYLACDRFDRMEAINQITLPTLVMAGEQDTSTPPKYARYLAERIPNAELVLIPEAGHLMPLEAPEQVNAALLNFLRRFHPSLV